MHENAPGRGERQEPNIITIGIARWEDFLLLPEKQGPEKGMICKSSGLRKIGQRKLEDAYQTSAKSRHPDGPPYDYVDGPPCDKAGGLPYDNGNGLPHKRRQSFVSSSSLGMSPLRSTTSHGRALRITPFSRKSPNSRKRRRESVE